jgi:hypothetical protein
VDVLSRRNVQETTPPTRVWSEGGAVGVLSRRMYKKQPHQLAFGARVGLWVCCRVETYKKQPHRLAFGARVGLWVCCHVETAHRLAFVARVGRVICWVVVAAGGGRRSKLPIVVSKVIKSNKNETYLGLETTRLEPLLLLQLHLLNPHPSSLLPLSLQSLSLLLSSLWVVGGGSGVTLAV